MVLKLENKKMIVDHLAKQASLAISSAVADYRGLTANQMTILRSKARESDVYVTIVRNRLAKIAIKKTEFSCMHSVLKGTLILAFSNKALGAPAKLFKEFIQKNNLLKVKHLVIDGKLFDGDKLDEISKLPTRKEIISLLCESKIEAYNL